MLLVRAFNNKTDANFVYNSWLKSYSSSAAVTLLSKRVYYKIFHDIISELMRSAKISVLCEKEDQEHIYGYIVTENDGEDKIVHYIYIKAPYRKAKLAESLCANQGVFSAKKVVYSHYTEAAKSLLAKCNSIEYNPFLLRGLYDKVEQYQVQGVVSSDPID